MYLIYNDNDSTQLAGVKLAALQLRQIEWQCTHEVNADRADVALCVGVIRKPEQEARLPYAGVADQKKFEEVVTAQTN
jgi:hypothetical protein